MLLVLLKMLYFAFALEFTPFLLPPLGLSSLLLSVLEGVIYPTLLVWENVDYLFNKEAKFLSELVGDLYLELSNFKTPITGMQVSSNFSYF